MTKKTTVCFNCKYHRDRANNFEKIILSMINRISRSDLKDILLKKKILKQDYLTNNITLNESSSKGEEANNNERVN